MINELYICSQCDGKGTTPLNTVNGEAQKICSKCFGAKKLDWIENIIGKESIFNDKYTYKLSGINSINERLTYNYIYSRIVEILKEFTFDSIMPDTMLIYKQIVEELLNTLIGRYIVENFLVYINDKTLKVRFQVNKSLDITTFTFELENYI